MEGALASVVAGLSDAPLIAVPTSVGYGASFHGLAALLTMLNSCAGGVTVVNIDNGFGAGYAASTICRKIHEGTGGARAALADAARADRAAVAGAARTARAKRAAKAAPAKRRGH
jgi:phosphoribosylcarboxyaminoimidazole (NCAIR) mutase